jgi:hypothetical protein
VYGLIPQHPRAGMTRGACCLKGVGAGPSNDEDYAAHEIGHFLGRHHPTEASGPTDCTHDAVDSGYPYFYTFIAPPLDDPNTTFAGFDGGDAGIGIRPSVRPAFIDLNSGSFDIMGYCQPSSWISDYTYRDMFGRLLFLQRQAAARKQASQGVARAGDWLLLFGHITPDGTRALLVDVRRVDRLFRDLPRLPGRHRIRLYDAAGDALADYGFTPEAASDARSPLGARTPELSFGVAVPFVPGTREVRIIDTGANSRVMASRLVSSNAPVVSDVALQGSPDLGGEVTLSWKAADADGDTLRFDLMAARDSGETLQPLRLGVSGNSALVDLSVLGGGNHRLRVIASDGLLTGFADSAKLPLANKPPLPRILSPGDGARVFLGQAINLDGDASDRQDGAIPAAGLSWRSAQGPIGSGPRATIDSLPVGTHVLTFSATNSLGLTASRTVRVIVDGNLATPGPTLTAGPLQIGWQVGVGEVQPQTAYVDIGNRGSGVLSFTAASGAPWLSVSAMTGTAPTRLTLTADPAGFADGVSADTTLTLTAVGAPAQVIVIPVRLATGNTFDAGNALPLVQGVAVFRDGFEP